MVNIYDPVVDRAEPSQAGSVSLARYCSARPGSVFSWNTELSLINKHWRHCNPGHRAMGRVVFLPRPEIIYINTPFSLPRPEVIYIWAWLISAPNGVSVNKQFQNSVTTSLTKLTFITYYILSCLDINK